MTKEEICKQIVNSIERPFKKYNKISDRSKIISHRENNIDYLVKRVIPQINEYEKQNLSYKTPEEWDEGFILLGGGQAYRKSSVILSHMTWEDFLRNLQEFRLNSNE